jgi:hypothetical protein
MIPRADDRARPADRESAEPSPDSGNCCRDALQGRTLCVRRRGRCRLSTQQRSTLGVSSRTEREPRGGEGVEVIGVVGREHDRGVSGDAFELPIEQ